MPSLYSYDVSGDKDEDDSTKPIRKLMNKDKYSNFSQQNSICSKLKIQLVLKKLKI